MSMLDDDFERGYRQGREAGWREAKERFDLEAQVLREQRDHFLKLLTDAEAMRVAPVFINSTQLKDIIT